MTRDGLTLAAGEHVVGLRGMEHDLADGRLVSREERGGLGGRAEVPHCQHAVLSPDLNAGLVAPTDQKIETKFSSVYYI